MTFLDRIFDEDEDVIRYVQTLTGYCLTGETTEQAFWVMYGTGANGKSTFIKTLLSLLGDPASISRHV